MTEDGDEDGFLEHGAPGDPCVYQRGAWTLAGHVRKRLRETPTMTREALRDGLRADRLLTWGTRGAQRLSGVLHDMRSNGEVALTEETVSAVALRTRRPPIKPIEGIETKRKRLAAKRARAVEKRKGIRASVAIHSETE